jgi:Uncharacterised nucleotidyltransferase
MYALWSLAQEQAVASVVELLRSEGIEPIVVKGWTVGHLYPDPALRPYGDIDLCVSSKNRAHAEAVLETSEGQRHNVDLQDSNDPDLHGRTWADVVARSQLVPLGDMKVRVLSPEDQLALLCHHFLRHGGWRPLWLCDIAAAVESQPETFNWETCLGSHPKHADWITCTIGLASSLLGATIEDTPIAGHAKQVPGWLVRRVVRAWESPYAGTHEPPNRYGPPLSAQWRHPRGLPTALRSRWPDPIRATISVGGPFNDLPRFPFQLANVALRTGKLLQRLPLRSSDGY